MKSLITALCLLFLGSYSGVAQVPSPRATAVNSVVGPSWTKTDDVGFILKDKSGKTLNNVENLLYLSTETLPVLDKDSRTIYLMEDFKEASIGSSGKASVLARNIGTNFYLTNPNSFGHFVNDTYYTGDFCNIGGSYVYYLEEKDATYYLKDIRNQEDWAAKNSIQLDYTSNHTYWYRDTSKGEFGVIEKGKTLDYDRVTSEKDGNDLIVKWDGVKTYVLPGYYTTASFVFKPVKMYGASSASTTGSSNAEGCVTGNCNDGWGKYQYKGGHYDGFWKNGLKNGYGLYKWEDTGKYIGEWVNDKMEGYGVYIADNKDNIIGQYRGGQLNGLGITVVGDKWEQGIFSDGSLVTPYDFITNEVETGCTAGDCQNKYGRYKWDNGDSYTGYFKNGKMFMGTYTFANGGKYSGMFNSENQFHGMGRYFFVDDAYYGGFWKNGKYHGRGYYHDENLKQQIGEWSNGELIKNLKSD